MFPFGFSCFRKKRLVQVFNQEYWFDTNIMIITYWIKVHFSIWALSSMLYDIGYLGTGYIWLSNLIIRHINVTKGEEDQIHHLCGYQPQLECSSFHLGYKF